MLANSYDPNGNASTTDGTWSAYWPGTTDSYGGNAYGSWDADGGEVVGPGNRLLTGGTYDYAYDARPQASSLPLYFFFGASSFPSVRYCGVTCSMFGVTSAFTLPNAHDRPPSRIDWKIGLSHTSSRWPIDV